MSTVVILADVRALAGAEPPPADYLERAEQALAEADWCLGRAGRPYAGIQERLHELQQLLDDRREQIGAAG